jgi:hypothetical protein
MYFDAGMARALGDVLIYHFQFSKYVHLHGMALTCSEFKKQMDTWKIFSLNFIYKKLKSKLASVRLDFQPKI